MEETMTDPFVSGLLLEQAQGVVDKLASLGVNAETVEGPPGLFSVRKTLPATGAAPQPVDPSAPLKLGEQQLRNLFNRCAYVFPEREMFFFGIRGALPANLEDWDFSTSKTLIPTKIDYKSMACTIGQWSPGKGVAAFPGSTVPNRSFLADAASHGGEGANALCRCKVAYVKGVHKQGFPTGHAAFIQDGYFPGTRSRDTVLGNDDDFIDTSNTIFFDDLHAAWASGPSKGMYSSAGCQVVAGFPHCKQRGDQPDIGPWSSFKAHAYDLAQNRFVYALFNLYDLTQANISN